MMEAKVVRNGKLVSIPLEYRGVLHPVMKLEWEYETDNSTPAAPKKAKPKPKASKKKPPRKRKS